mgnify:CR=1 FL=1
MLIQAFHKAHGIGDAHAVVIHGMPAESGHRILRPPGFPVKNRLLPPPVPFRAQKSAEAVMPLRMNLLLSGNDRIGKDHGVRTVLPSLHRTEGTEFFAVPVDSQAGCQMASGGEAADRDFGGIHSHILPRAPSICTTLAESSHNGVKPVAGRSISFPVVL